MTPNVVIVPDAAEVQAASTRCAEVRIVIDRLVPPLGAWVLGPDLTRSFAGWRTLATLRDGSTDLLVVALARHTPHPEA